MLNEEQRAAIQEETVRMLRTVYDPEIPVDIFSLGLIYNIDLDEEGNVKIDMTLTAPSCPASDFLMEDIPMKLAGINGVKKATVNLVF